MNSRIIFHIDMDAFFAAVEVVRNPLLKGKALIVGGHPDSRGVVSTCSYEARAYGVRSAMSLFEAKKRCPHAIFVQGNYQSYREYSHQIMEILQEFSSFIEIVSIDEAYQDVTSIVNEFGNAFELGRLIRKKVFEETLLTCSLGIGSNKLIAKIASGLAKPNGMYEIPAGFEKSFLYDLPIQSIPGIGTKTQMIFNRDNIKMIGDVQNLGIDEMVLRYGHRGYAFYLTCLGKDNRPVHWEDRIPKSIGAETTFEKDLLDRESLIEIMAELTEKAWKRLRKYKMRARRISIKLRDNTFKTITRSHTLNNHRNDLETISNEVIAIFDKSYTGTLPLRLIGLSLEELTDNYWQPTFWD